MIWRVPGAVAMLVVAPCTSLACAEHSRRAECWDPVLMARNSHAGRITGTFTDLRADERGVVGIEVRIAVTEQPQFQAIVQFGAGDFCAPADYGTSECFGVSSLYAVEVALNESRPGTGHAVALSFDVNGGDRFAGHFEGIVTDEALRGTFTRAGGEARQIELPRGISHWEK